MLKLPQKSPIKPQSTRAKRRQEKQIDKSKNKRLQNALKSGKLSRFDAKTRTNSFDGLLPITPNTSTSAPTSAPTSTTTDTKDPKKSKLTYEDEKKLFQEKPELFEKRMVIIDGSNVARM